MGPDGASPALTGDERVLVAKPPKYGGKPVTPEERIAFFSAVMQHEFFHHLYCSYPEFKLEERSHQWFNRASWPRDFEGLIEPDYYAESLHKLCCCPSCPSPVRRCGRSCGMLSPPMF